MVGRVHIVLEHLLLAAVELDKNFVPGFFWQLCSRLVGWDKFTWGKVGEQSLYSIDDTGGGEERSVFVVLMMTGVGRRAVSL